MEMLPVTAAPGGPRKAQALSFICEYIETRGHSPSMVDIARELRVTRQRAKHLVDQLMVDGAIERLTGAQRAIVVPGLTQRVAIAQLRKLGFVVDEDVRAIATPGLPKGNLPLVAIIDHLHPDDEDRK